MVMGAVFDLVPFARTHCCLICKVILYPEERFTYNAV